METILIIGLGGFIGANVRYWLAQWALQRFGTSFPWGTLIINVSGSFLLAIFLAWLLNHTGVDPRWRLLIAVGFFGAYTTFSTYATESAALLQSANWVGAAADIVGSNGLCVIGALIGLAIGNRL